MRGRADRRQGVRSTALIPLVIALGMGGCDSLLTVSQPGVVQAGDLDDPALTRTLVVEGIGKFECALTQYALSTGGLVGEFIGASLGRAVSAWYQRVDGARDNLGTCGGSPGAFFALQQARTQTEEGYRLISGFPDDAVPDKERNLGMLAAYAGYAHILLGEGFCEMTLDGGPSMRPEEVLAIAEERLSSAIDHATRAGDDEILQMALTGRARVRLNLGHMGLAAGDAKQVSEGFVRNATRSNVNSSRRNQVFWQNNQQRAWSVAPEYHDLEVDGVPDPRVPIQDGGAFGPDGITRWWIQLKYPEPGSDVRIASWEEAQLIIAEVEGGQAAVEAINRLRTQWGLPLFESDDPEEIMDQVLEERRRQFFADGHRINDMLRHDIPFATGVDHKGLTFGEMTCMYLPRAETDNNPHLR